MHFQTKSDSKIYIMDQRLKDDRKWLKYIKIYLVIVSNTQKQKLTLKVPLSITQNIMIIANIYFSKEANTLTKITVYNTIISNCYN